ncbi:MAG: TetR/AcrR family transcriptional regulator [Myxococcales bacterium]
MTPRQTHVHPLRSVARPKQARSEESLRRLLDAAESLLEEKRFGEISVSDIAKRARSSVGGFYARFRDKDELLLALHERFVAQLEARLGQLEGSLAGPHKPAPVRELALLLRPAIQLLIETYRAHHGALTAFASRASENRRLWKAGTTFRSQVIARFTGLMLLSRHEFSHPDPELAAELSVQLALGFMEQTLLNGAVHAGGEPVPDGRLQEELERILVSYLGVPQGP